MSNYNVRKIALDVLIAIEQNQAYSNLTLNHQIKHHKLSNLDAGLLTEIVYGTVQRKLTIDYYLAPFLKKPKKMQTWVIVLLRLSAYQMIYLDRIPSHAIIHEAVEIAKKRGHRGISSMVNAVLRNLQREGLASTEEIDHKLDRLATETSHPKWLVKRWSDQFSFDKAKAICEANLQPPKQTIRVNTKYYKRDEVLVRLKEQGIEAEKSDLLAEAAEVKKGNAANTQAFKDGLFTVQDESSMLVAHALDPQDGDHILDSCAAPGGKTTHIAQMIQNGKVTALDIHNHKALLIEGQAERLRLENVDAKVCDARKAGSLFERESFNRILVDAPCSGFGVIRRKPDIKYTKTEEDVMKLQHIQLEILSAVAPLLKKDGVLVYSTCTIDREENGDVVQAFLEAHEDFELHPQFKDRMPAKVAGKIENGTLQILPSDFGTDGFYIACFRKKV
ncbi:16S rRNA (cytosine(967)-C(5))-methyltransferase RsmB [Priestia endophytica]|uniref:16S rRNA (cytosine(967)-C(5))-methyltransferase RsmB n=1 Tax=Priestia endophytica TaxID=135735 RepID=UPI00124BE1DB|nr:16S rRNA (cytosine(967)-C(5))-methyltransferase RsmB [Priestia endophytica]KAB2494742.1 16S rRNA (cytosine(967)-C(5))-methyltransferase RsmB [Priestia endophytica]